MSRYRDALGQWRKIRPAARKALHEAMRVTPDDRTLGDVRVVRAGRTTPLAQPIQVSLESGEVLRLQRRIPSDLPEGVHGIQSLDGTPTGWLIVSPGTCHEVPEGQRWGWAAQLYAVRSRKSWGIGDLGDLRALNRWSRDDVGMAFNLLNPLGAQLPIVPQENSPYFPSSRLFLNPLYLRVEEMPGARALSGTIRALAAQGHALNRERLIDRDEVFRLKMKAAELLWKQFEGNPRFDRFRAEQGDLLRSFATFNTLAEHHGSGWSRWPVQYRKPNSEAVNRFAREHARRVDFHAWLQWILDEQLARAAAELPLMLDVPVGVRPDGFDAWLWQDLMALDVGVGAPPDEYNTLGQNWGLPPFIPHRLRSTGYAAWRQTLRAMFRHAGALRVDHILGLFRLYWIPRGAHAAMGGFVRYRAEELLAILAMESQRAKAVVVGEDLGTVEPGVRATMRRHNILSYRLLWFERTRPERYPAESLAAVTTHDLFTIAGLWNGSDLEAQQRLGLNPNAAGMRRIRRRVAGMAGVRENAPVDEVIPKVHALLGRSPCKLLTATLDDALGIEERPNMPGTVDQWPNWRLALPEDPTRRELHRLRIHRRAGLKK